MPPQTVQVFQRPALIRVGGYKLTDHNRSELSISFERIENSQRMANGTLRKFVVATKHSFDVSWKELPSSGPWTVDGFWGGKEILSYYRSQIVPFTLSVYDGGGAVQTFQVVFESFSYDIAKRGQVDLWNMSATFEEV